ncbi:MAG TPA: DMT family transporter [Stackebrandtia sp.]|jgi:transporter family-2 protein|uniref:DMT family transporter n=1 Tax=Stackebrandtia sp. TaxID=2023065 RepID=UPI002D447619|nr:DMT family transporter [Stackebrandtia sp.]HZE41570.1 DMT family transporter [Stackebrandtia sp.]
MNVIVRPRSPRRTIPVWLALALSVAGGGCGAAQAAVNGHLGERLGSPVLAAGVSNTFGGLLFIIATLALTRVRTGLGRIWRDRLPLWMYSGGLFGAFFVFAGAYAAPLIGVALFTVAQVCGNTMGALGCDAVGLGPSGRLRITVFRLTGAITAIVAVAVAQAGRELHAAAWWLVPLVVVVGIGLSLQAALNGRVNEIAGNPLSTGLVNFTVGTVALYLVIGVLALAVGFGDFRFPPQPWLYLGGLLGSALLLCSVIAVKRIGVLRMALGILAGQLAGALAIDIAGGRVPSAFTIAGLALTAVAGALAGRGARAPSDADVQRLTSRR